MKKIPDQYLPIMPYLIVKNAKAFEKFVITVFDAKVQLSVPRDASTIQHGELRIGDAVIMYADSTDQSNARPCGMFVYIESVDKVYKSALDNGAKSLMTPMKQEYGYTAGFEDNYGNQWWIAEP
jgi:PhnB protein